MKNDLSVVLFTKSLLTKTFCTVLCCLIISSTYFSQKPSKEEKKLYKKAKNQLINEDFKEAQNSYLKLVEINSKNETYNFEGGLSYYFSDFERAKCIPLFEATLENSKEDTIPELYYYLARAYHFNGQYDKAKEAFNSFKPFIKTNSNSGQELMKQSEYFIKISDNGAQYLIDKDENILITNLDNGVNSSYGEYAPVLKSDEDVLLFTSRRKVANSKKTDKDLLPYENVYAAKKSGDVWQVITDDNEIEKYIPKHLNSKTHDAGIIYSSDGRTLYTYKNDAIWKSILENGKWSKLVELDKNINSSQYNIPSVSLSKDGNTIFFVSYRKDGIGGKDIYKSVKNGEGNWSKAENLGETINTKLDEDSPYLSENGKTLYFASKGHEGIGGYDIFKSQLVNGSWSSPQNMGIPINSSVDDIYLIIDDKEMNGFFASARDGGHGGMDIYSVCMNCPTKITNIINGLLVDNNDSPLNNGSISVKNTASDKTIGVYETNAGKFSLTTEKTGKHELLVTAPNFEKQTIYIEFPNTSSESDIKIKLNQFQKEDDTYQVINLSSNKLNLNVSDTIKLEKIIAVNNNDTKNNTDLKNDIDHSIAGKTIASYQEFFGYNLKNININDTKFIQMINKTLDKAKTGKIYINIESSASRVSTKEFNTNNRLATERGKEAKDLIVKLLIEKGINKESIIINPINNYVSGPKYNGDYKNTEKYKQYQYVKIEVK